MAETEKVPEDADPPEEKAEEPKTEEEPEKEAETVSAPSTTSSTTIVSKEIVTIGEFIYTNYVVSFYRKHFDLMILLDISVLFIICQYS